MEEVIDEWPDDTSLVVTEDCVNEEVDDSNKNYFIEEIETEVHD